MPICKQCNKQFPNRVEINGVKKLLCSRKYCLDCSPYGKHNTKTLNKEISECVCKKCNRSFSFDRRKNHTYNTCNTCVTKSRHRLIKKKAIEYLGGKCTKCGYMKCFMALDFHHLNPDDKDFSISANYNRKWESLVEELNKCVLLCSNCHREIHNMGD